MAGKRQHFIPRFLQRGFSIEKNGKYFSCLCKKEFIKENILIENIGLENYFYTLNDYFSIDEEITKKETYIYSGIIKKLLDKYFSLDDKFAISDFIYHMEIRTRSLRSNFTRSACYLTNQLKIRLLSKESISTYFEKHIVNVPLKLDALIREEIDKLSVPPLIHQEIKQNILDNIHIYLPSIASDISMKLIPAFEEMIDSGIPEVAKKGHLKGILSNSSLKKEEYQKLHYIVIKTDQPLILGDCIVIFEVKGIRKFKPFYEKDDDLQSVFMPLDSHTLLYGAKNPEDKPNIDELNFVIAKCSTDFFICESYIPKLDELRQLIGDNSYFLTNDDIDKIIESMINDALE
ncbi:hypothetical protein AU512_04975 [Lonsdalea iberica]|uniref:DUF4238 domain-containing protein n=1 Tax=Lonsdalea iberica TaxID=1082703 RepID=A0ABX3XIZ4_9GAMM|nr:DUF4238 domain-containing protein [Lonsdalea iberica]OSN11131.1 hypothetical protein AU512_04975 [Lonsdalea iberica]